MGGEAVCLTVEAIAGSRTQETAVPRSETVCSRRFWAGGPEEDMVGRRRRREEEKKEKKEEDRGRSRTK